MANEEKKGKKVDRSLPMLVFLIGLALIIGGTLMQIGWFDTSSGNPTPAASNTSDDQNTTTDDSATATTEGTEELSDVDFSVTTIENNVAIPVKKDVEYTYGSDFKMTVTDLQVTCTEGVCGADNDSVSLKFVSTAGQEYPITLTPSSNTQNLVDVPVSVQEWHDGYVVIYLQK